MVNMCFSRIVFSFVILITMSAFPAPRINQALTDIVHEATCLAEKDATLHQSLLSILGKETLELATKQRRSTIAKVPHASLEQARDVLSSDHRRTLIAHTLHDFFNPSSENDKYGTVYYAEKLTQLCSTADRNNKTAVTFENDHKAFCSTFASKANTNAISLGNSVKTAYGQIKDNDTKKAVKDVLTKVGQQNRLKLACLITRRIKNNA